MNQQLVDNVILMALAEDAPWGDVTSEAFVPEDATATAVLNAREAGVVSGLEVFARTFQLVDAQAEVTLHASDGDSFTAGQQPSRAMRAPYCAPNVLLSTSPSGCQGSRRRRQPTSRKSRARTHGLSIPARRRRDCALWNVTLCVQAAVTITGSVSRML